MYRYDIGMPFLLKYENVAWYEDGKVRILDRRVYPYKVCFEECGAYMEVVRAIQNMVTQSAGPYTAVGMGMALAAYESRNLAENERIEFLKKAAFDLGNARVTTANRYSKITNKCFEIAKDAILKGEDPVDKIVEETINSLNRRYSIMRKVGENLLGLIEENSTVLTQCYGETIIGALIAIAKERNKNFKVICAETRPFLQGARLTASCFAEKDFDTIVITDNMVADTMNRGKIQLFTSAADSITEDGCVINKVGTFQIALVADHFNIPYYVTGIPDKGKKTANDVKIEIRDPESVISMHGIIHTYGGVKGWYPSFDCTPTEYVTGVVTDRGIFKSTKLNGYFELMDKGESFY